jgi:hypothetical protein
VYQAHVLADDALALAARQALLLQSVGDVPAHREPRKERVALEHDAAVRTRSFHQAPPQPDGSGSGLQEAAYEIEQRALAAAARSDDGDEFALGDIEIDELERAHRLRAFAIAHGDGAQLEVRVRHLAYLGR